MSKESRTAAKASIYQTVTDRVIASLKAGVIPWEKPWQTPRFHWRPFSAQLPHRQTLSRHECFVLWSCNYSSPFWLTFKQAQET